MELIKKIPRSKAIAAIERFGENVDLEAMKLFLSEHEIGSKFETLLAMLSDPAYQGLKFSTVARKANVSIAELQALYTDGMRHIGMLHLVSALPEIMFDVATDAKTTMVPCPRCDGVGFVRFGDGDRVCPLCEGGKSVRKVGDKHARDLVFQSAKLTGQSGPLVAIQNNYNEGDSRMESMLKRTRQITLEPKKVRPLLEEE